MVLSRDIYGKLKYSQLHLANPQKQYIDILSGVKELKLKVFANSISEITFKIYEYEDGIRNELYDLIEQRRLIEMQYVAWFQIQEINETHDENSIAMYKVVTAYTLENELIGKFVYALDGVYALYDATDTEYSLLHIISQYCGWTINHVDNELLNKWRTLSIDEERIYNLLTGKIASSFECVFQFDTFSKSISAYSIENFGKLTNITISDRNVLQQFEKSADSDGIITQMMVRGGQNEDGTIFDLRAVLPDGSTVLVNLDYYTVPYDPVTKTGWMTQDLVNALQAYKTAYNDYSNQSSTLLDTLKQYESELTVLNSELKDIQSIYDAADLTRGTYISKLNRVPISSDAEYTLYQNALTQMNTAFNNKQAKQMQINNKQSQINGIQILLNNIGAELDKNKYFTSDQMKELETFLTQGDTFSDDTYLAYDNMTNEEIIELKLELKAVAEKELTRVSRPQYSYETTLNNFLSIIGDGYEDWQDDFDLSNFVTLLFRENYTPTVRIMMMEFDFDNLSDFKITFSDKTRLDDKLVQLAETIAQSSRTANSISLKELGYDAASRQTSIVRDFMNSALNATTNRVISDTNVQNEFSQFGLLNRKWLPDQNKYDDHQSLLTQNILLFTDDSWKSSKTGIGYFTNNNNETFYGVIGDVLVGNIILGEQLTIKNTSGTYKIDKNGFTAQSGIYSVGINPSTPSEIFNIKVNGSNQLYVDTTNQSLVYNGKITSSSGSIGGWSIGSTTLTSSGSATININNGGNKSMILDYNGLSLYNKNLVDSHYGDVTAIWDGSSVGGMMLSQGLNANMIAIGHNISASQHDIAMIFTNDGFSSSTFGNTSAGFHFYRNVDVNASLTVGHNTVIHSGNYSSLGLIYPTNGSTHYHSEYAPVTHYQYSTTINPVTTGAGNVGLNGLNVASVNWCNETFELKTSSDFRLKQDILSLDDRLSIFFDNLKAKQYRFKPINDGSIESPKDDMKTHFGFIAQEVRNCLINSGLEDNFAIVKTRPTRSYTNECLYVDDEIMIINYEELIALTIDQVQKMKLEINKLNEILNNNKV